ncbi:hypothetical protein BBBOND_0107650 [Babesia bigemina]|uniref:Uncharacterized protein n=1 Tax=Babesia bigemina TaxID=5866 RepID=A0A061D2Z6_BABBI|nr:hypothetical protein BBBOND_0107650 [Babesia bigemina]CDR94467.1 hypothetical protein BBBOND_0107650 [Babesia bigemina]|eukprot:XP_012766653.1 hypothetical protein BBBOND_0107650 [Babesia bigemina]
MVYNSLTEVPRNLKEGIDWLIALKGTDGAKNLKAMGAALYNFLSDKPVGLTEVPALENVKHISQQFLEQPELMDRPFVKNLVERFNKPTGESQQMHDPVSMGVKESDYKNIVEAWNITPENIARSLGKVVDGCEKFLEEVKIPENYTFAYSSGATWDSSCAKDPEACAVVLVGIAPMLYAGIRSLRDAGKDATAKETDPMEDKHLGSVLEALGYKEPAGRAALNTSDVLNLLRVVDKNVLNILYAFSGFWGFYGLDIPVDVDDEPFVDFEDLASMDFDDDPSVDFEDLASMDFDDEPFVDFEDLASMDFDDDPSVDFEGLASMDFDDEPSVDFDGLSSVDTDAESVKVDKLIKGGKKGLKKYSKKALKRALKKAQLKKLKNSGKKLPPKYAKKLAKKLAKKAAKKSAKKDKKKQVLLQLPQ